eukprot:4922224-Prymnesium_polylepis.1
MTPAGPAPALAGGRTSHGASSTAPPSLQCASTAFHLAALCSARRASAAVSRAGSGGGSAGDTRSERSGPCASATDVPRAGAVRASSTTVP